MEHWERPRRLVGPAQGLRNDLGGALGPAPATGSAPRHPGTAADRYRERSAALREACARLDAGVDDATRRQLADWIREQYEVHHHGAPVGWVARCLLGPPYVDHTLDLFGSILVHYAPADPMPEPCASARTLARNSAYAWVEVYSDGSLVPVLTDGRPVRSPGTRSENNR
ncbi:hypothetical protein [Streptomyces sp. NPDC012888]|uniref:hypothetical protein n=1 Tax=Streptomyces sp. NPDC012888 TaxID=3364855 RepID=UPI0036BDD96A